MKTRIDVLSLAKKSGNKNGKDWSMTVCQCVAHTVEAATGAIVPMIGELILPKGHPEIAPGQYDGEFAISIGHDKSIGGRLVQLIPVGVARSVSSVPVPKL